jgi:ribosomal protein L12E/L44/L45/RPP1/RPP2
MFPRDSGGLTTALLQLIAEGSTKLASVPSGGAGGAPSGAPAATGGAPAAEEKVEEKEEEKEVRTHALLASKRFQE